ncbi:hypothetical protein D3C71_1796970 [compost metagenome]
MPLVRMMVNSELWAKRAITKMVPMSTVMGNSSYRWLGMLNVTNKRACDSWYPSAPARPTQRNSSIRSKKKNSARKPAVTKATADKASR